MNKRQKAIRDKDKGRIMTAAEWEYATDDYKHLRKNKKIKKTNNQLEVCMLKRIYTLLGRHLCF